MNDGWRLHTPASATSAARTLSRRQCARRLPKNQGYKASPRSALSADGEANKGTRGAAARLETPTHNSLSI